MKHIYLLNCDILGDRNKNPNRVIQLTYPGEGRDKLSARRVRTVQPMGDGEGLGEVPGREDATHEHGLSEGLGEGS